MTRAEMDQLAIGDRVIRTRDDGFEESGTVKERSQTLLYVEWPSGQEGIVEIRDNPTFRREESER